MMQKNGSTCIFKLFAVSMDCLRGLIRTCGNKEAALIWLNGFWIDVKNLTSFISITIADDIIISMGMNQLSTLNLVV